MQNEQVVFSMMLAPSAHNTQPWQFTMDRNTIDIFVDWERHLDVSDPEKRQLYVSLGCAIENGVIAGQHFGCNVSVTYFPQGESSAAPAARLTLTGDGERDQHMSDLYAALPDRRTNRQEYDGKPLTETERSALRSRQDAGVFFVENRKTIITFAQASEEGTSRTLSRKDFKEELSHWVRNNWTKQDDGMPGYAMGMPAPISLIAHLMVKIAPIHKQEAPKVKRQIESASAVAIIVTDEDNPQAWIKAGQTMERLWLEATVAHLAAAPLAAAIEAGKEERQAIREALSTDKYPQALLRIGHASSNNLQSTPRRTLEDVVK
ncbi:MAG: Acg family FMN-binding oxidoreductase [Candidatus Binatia bacterium]